MFPPIVQWMNDSPAVVALLKPAGVMRIYQDEKPQDQGDGDYAVFTLIHGNPEKSFDCAPSIDHLRIQFDCYSSDRLRCRQIFAAIRDVLEAHGYVDYLPSLKESGTRDYRLSLDFMRWEHR
jgi:hypothetical protein